MLRSRKMALIAAIVAGFAMAGAALVYSGMGGFADTDPSPLPELFSNLPSGAPTLVYADLAAIRASAFYQQRPDHGPLTVPDRDYADFVRSTGFDFEQDLDRVAIASWPALPNQGKQKTMLVAEGRFDKKKIHDYALRKGKVELQNGREVFLFPTDNPARWNSVSFLTDHRIGIVEGPSIAPLLERHDAPPGGDASRDRAARVAGASLFAITQVPPIPDNASAGGVSSPKLAALARSVQWVMLAAKPEGDAVRVSLEGECLSATDARELQATLEVFRQIGQAALESPKNRQSMDPASYQVAETILKNSEISASAERVRILVELGPDVLKLGEPRKAQ